MTFFSYSRTGTTRQPLKCGETAPYLPLLLVCVLGAVIAGCHSSNNSGGGGSAFNSQQGDEVAKVNNDVITVGEMYDFMQRLTPQQMASSPNEPVGKFALSNLITTHLIEQLAANNKVPVTDQEVDQRYKDLALLTSWEIPIPYEQYLTMTNQTPETIKEYAIRPQMAQFNLMTRSVQVTPQEIQAYYNAHQNLYTIQRAVEIERVVCPTKDAAQQVYDGVSKGGSMASFQSQNMMPPTPGSDPTLLTQWLAVDPPSPALGPLGKPLAAAKVGDTLKPIQLGQQWWVVHVVQNRPKTVVPFDQVQNIVRMTVLQSKAGPDVMPNFVHDLQQFQQSAAITVKPPQYQDLVQQLKNPTPPQFGAPAPAAPAPSAPKK